jgi:hypothetical protein
MKLVWLIIMCLNETDSKVCISKQFSDNFPIHNGLKPGEALSPPVSTLLQDRPLGRSMKIKLD